MQLIPMDLLEWVSFVSFLRWGEGMDYIIWEGNRFVLSKPNVPKLKFWTDSGSCSFVTLFRFLAIHVSIWLCTCLLGTIWKTSPDKRFFNFARKQVRYFDSIEANVCHWMKDGGGYESTNSSQPCCCCCCSHKTILLDSYSKLESMFCWPRQIGPISRAT